MIIKLQFRGSYLSRFIILGVLLCSGFSIKAGEWQMLPMPGQPQAVPFTLPGLDGKLHSLKDYRNKFLLVNFWSNSCGVCLHEMSALHHHNKSMSDKRYEVIAIHAGPGEDQIRETLEKNPVDYTILIDADLKMGAWNIPSLPTSYLVSPQGKLLYRYVGTREWASPKMIKFIEHVIDENKENNDTASQTSKENGSLNSIPTNSEKSNNL